MNEISRPNFCKLQASLESNPCKINAKYGKKKNELQAIKTLTQIRKFETSILQADKAQVEMWEREREKREREREWLCVILFVCRCECEGKGKGSKGIFGNMKKGGGAGKATWNECLFFKRKKIVVVCRCISQFALSLLECVFFFFCWILLECV